MKIDKLRLERKGKKHQVNFKDLEVQHIHGNKFIVLSPPLHVTTKELHVIIFRIVGVLRH